MPDERSTVATTAWLDERSAVAAAVGKARRFRVREGSLKGGDEAEEARVLSISIHFSKKYKVTLGKELFVQF